MKIERGGEEGKRGGKRGKGRAAISFLFILYFYG
jgi:hypothetical protein